MASTKVSREFTRESFDLELMVKPDDAPIAGHFDCCLTMGLERFSDDVVRHLDWVGAKIVEPEEGWVNSSDSITVNVVGVQVQLTVTVAFNGPVDPTFIAADVLAWVGPEFISVVSEKILKEHVGGLLVSTGYGAKADELSGQELAELSQLVGEIFGKLGDVEVVKMGDVAGIPAFAIRFDGDDEPDGPAAHASQN